MFYARNVTNDTERYICILRDRETGNLLPNLTDDVAKATAFAYVNTAKEMISRMAERTRNGRNWEIIGVER